MDVRVVLLAVLVVLAGCNTLFGPAEPDPSSPSEATDRPVIKPPDPPSDRLGWEGGYWYNETIAVDNTDGLNETERVAVLNRTMARIERIRQLEFKRPVPVTIERRDEFRDRLTTNYSEDFRHFDNAKFEAMFLVGSDTDSLAVQEQNRGESILGLYDFNNRTMVLVSDGGGPTLRGDGTLAHELVHALQDQHFNLSRYTTPTRDAYAGQRGLFEGDANFVQRQYMARCGDQWACVQPADDGGAGPPQNLHYGVYFLSYFPYSEGEVFVHDVHADGGWDAVNALFDDPPQSAEEVIYSAKYGDDPPVNVTFSDTHTDEWRRLRPDPQQEGVPRPDYAVIGQSGLSAMFAHTFSSELTATGYGSYNDSMVVNPSQMVNSFAAQDSSSEYISYDLNYTRGWEGDRLHAYERDGELAYVWRLVWENRTEAVEFRHGYRRVLQHWGATPVDRGTWTIGDDSPFTGAYYVDVAEDTVTIVKAPTVDDLSGVYAGTDR